MDKELIEFEANFSVLDRYGTYVTNEEYITDPAIGRDQQIKELILILLTPEKSAILIGKPGIGKTAIVEGLAYRIQKNDVPEALKGYEIINIKTASLLGTMPSGESKVQKMIDELKTKEKLILFIDEVHMLIGATDSSSLDFANIFKEGLGRGSIKVIGATTTEEYERYILRDKAFTRRFQKIEVPEPSRDETIKIMMGTLPKFEKQTGRKMKYTSFIQERIMSFLVDITSEYKRVYALGSRYPDVCLTLLKQAFSYTVYDNRQYMDIFDVRKAIENSKNIYPDVIKKELPNFDKLFNDIILEEKGEKPVEEWRNEGNNASSIIDNGDDKKKKNQDEQDFSVLSNKPEIVDRKDLKDGNPVQSIVSITGKRKVAKVGSVDVPKGLKEKISRADNVEELDDMLLASDVGVIKEEKPKGPKLPTQYVVTDEIKEGVNDSYLLGRPIESTNDRIQADEEEFVDVYKLNNSKKNKKNEGRKMWNNGNSRPERQDISSQNFDKYNNYFHRDDDYSQNNEQYENKKRMDMLMGPTFSDPNGMNNQMDQNNYDMPNNYGPMNGPMDMPNNYGPMSGPMDMPNNYGPMSGPMDMSNNYGPMNGPVNMPNNYGQMNGPVNMPNNYGPMNGPVNMPNSYGPMNGPMDMPNNYGPMNNGGNYNNGNETLFGAPMYDAPVNNEYNNVPDIYGSANNINPNNSFLPTNNQQQGFDINQPSSGSNETLFGAPMYSDVSGPDGNVSNNNSDVFGQLITDNMRIKNGKIVDEFPTFDKIDNLANIKSVISDVREVSNSNNNNQNNNQSFLNMNNNQEQTQSQPQEMSNNQNADPNAGKKWTFIDNPAVGNQPQGNNSFLPIDNSTSQENTISPAANSAEPTNNKDYYEDMKSGNFVNFTELNNGKIKEEDANKYMGIQTQEDKPKYDLNLESNAEEDDNKFDDFFE